MWLKMQMHYSSIRQFTQQSVKVRPETVSGSALSLGRFPDW